MGLWFHIPMSVEAISDDNQEQYPSVREIFRRAKERKLAQASIEVISTLEMDNDLEYLTQSTMIVRSQELADKGLLSQQELSTLRDFWNIIANYYMHHHTEQIIPVHREHLATLEARWAASGLTTIDETTAHMGRVPVNVLRDSIVSGNIKAIFNSGGEYMVHTMAKFLEHLTGLPTELGEFDRTWLDNELESLKRRHEVLKDMVGEGAERTYTGKHYGGPYKQYFAPILHKVQNEIRTIHPDLDIDALHTDDYRDNYTALLVKRLGERERMKFPAIAQWRFNQSIAVHEATWESDKQQIIPLGLFNRPRGTKYGDHRACATVAFRVLHQGITGLFVGEDELRQMMSAQHNQRFVADQEYLKLFETDAFRNEYGKRVQSLQFMGMNLDTLRVIAERKRAQHDDMAIFAVANLATESVKGRDSEIATRIQHRVVIYGADEDYVYLFDPNHPNQDKMDKRRFCHRWSATQNSGYLVVAK